LRPLIYFHPGTRFFQTLCRGFPFRRVCPVPPPPVLSVGLCLPSLPQLFAGLPAISTHFFHDLISVSPFLVPSNHSFLSADASRSSPSRLPQRPPLPTAICLCPIFIFHLSLQDFSTSGGCLSTPLMEFPSCRPAAFPSHFGCLCRISESPESTSVSPPQPSCLVCLFLPSGLSNFHPPTSRASV